MAIAFDNQLNTQVDSSTTSVTRSFTVTGSDTCVVSNALTTTAADMSSITYAGTTLTKVGETNQDAFSTETHFLVNTATGANNMVWNNGSSATFVTNATSYTGVRNTSYTPASSTNNGSGTTVSDSLTTTVANSWIVACSRTGGGFPDATGTNYVREAFNTTNGVHIGSSQTGLSAQSNTVSFGISLSQSWSVLLFELEESAAAPTSDIKSIAGVTQANIKSIAGVTNANIKSVAGVSNS